MKQVHNTLVISDLHLGGDLNPRAWRSKAPQLAILERQLVSFLQHYTYTRRNGVPWRLISNGDMIDFLGIRLLPGAEHVNATPDEHTYGLGRRPRVARAKVEAVVERHAAYFRALARFIAAGNKLDIVAGNHDVEFQWKPVQLAFVDGVRRAWEDQQAARGRDVSSEHIAESITFHPWFFYEPGVAWVEHGHLYDENCSFEYGLAPADPDSKQIDVNVDTASARYVINHIPEADYGQEMWSALGYLRWGWSLGPRGLWNVAKSYTAFSMRLLAARRQRAKMPGAHEVRRERHRERMLKLAEHWCLDEKTLGAVDQLRKRPVINNLWRLLQVLMIDKLIIGAVALLALMVLVWSLPLLWGFAAAGTVLATAWFANGFLSRNRNVDPTGPLMIVPDRILRHVDAQYVVFGHTHDALELDLEDGGTYYNTGTWFPDELPGLLRCFTHLVILHGEHGTTAELCQWRDGASRAYTPGYSVRTRPPTADPAPAPQPEPVGDDAMAA